LNAGNTGSRLAIFGGTFDPIHQAHLVVARTAADRFTLDRVLFVPASQPPHKWGATSASYEDRYRMVELACDVDPRFIPSRIEEADAKSYSIQTIEKIQAALQPNDELFFLIGADAFSEIATWHRYEDVIRSVQFIVVTRPGHDYAVPEGGRIHKLDTVDLPVSSSAIRELLAKGRLPTPLSPPVAQYIEDNGLYGYPKARY
jgi:nicotinate-nucleotide adenylyltransferase